MQPSPLYPLRFRPIFRRYLWGNRRLGTVLRKPIGPGNDWAESWEISDHGADQSIVEFGPLAGATLGQLVQERGKELLGRHHPAARFPLLLKFLDANRALSVQVHPNDAQAARLNPPDSGKTEAWVVLEATADSRIFAGLKPGVDRPRLATALHDGDCQGLLHVIKPSPGDSIFLPAGTVHAVGEGLLVAEIQQSSDVTYRLFDWNRLGPDGQRRPLQIEQGLDAVDFRRGPVSPQQPQPTERPEVDAWLNASISCLTAGVSIRSYPPAVTEDATSLPCLRAKCASKATRAMRRSNEGIPFCFRPASAKSCSALRAKRFCWTPLFRDNGRLSPSEWGNAMAHGCNTLPCHWLRR